MSSGENETDEKVGYKKPPANRRFQPGQSGNLRGRPKKALNIGFEIVAELKRKVTVRENGVPQTMSKAAALAKSLVARAMAGDMRAMGHLMKMLPAQFQTPDTPDSGADAALDAAESAALARFVARRLAATEGTAGDQEPLESGNKRGGGDE